MPPIPELGRAYDMLRVTADRDLKSALTRDAIAAVAALGLDFLAAKCERQDLTCDVPGKKYFSFRARGQPALSRPVNRALFDPDAVKQHGEEVLHGDPRRLPKEVVAQVLYSLAMSYCFASDLTRTGDRKTPGTFFEIMIGHLVARTLKTNPDRQIQVLNLELDNTLPTDYVFDLGADKSRIHLPVKTSTRERVIQVWAHQRVLDGVFGVGRFKGILVCLPRRTPNRTTA